MAKIWTAGSEPVTLPFTSSQVELALKMKLSSSFSLLTHLRFAIQVAFFPTLRALLRSPLTIFRPVTLSRIFMSHVWMAFGDDVDLNGRPVKEQLLTPNARGVVLELGAGHGHTVKYLDRQKITKYVALEPNVLMHAKIRELANAEGYIEADGTLTILSCGAEDISSITGALDFRAVDTIVSVLTLCTVPEPERTLQGLVGDVLKEGGELLFYEHVLSHRPDVAWWQRFWTPIWKRAFDGCNLDRPSHLLIESVGMWKEHDVWGKVDEDEENLFWSQAGRFVKN